MDIVNFLNNESDDFKIIEHELEAIGQEDEEGIVTLRVKCQNGKEFTLCGYANDEDSFTYYSQFLDDLYAQIENKIQQLIAPQIKDICQKEFDKNELLSDDVFRKEKDGDIVFTFRKTPEDSYGTTTYEIAAFDNGLRIGGVEGCRIPDAYHANNTIHLMDSISGGCLRIWEEIYGRKKEKIVKQLRKYFFVEYGDLIVIERLNVIEAYRGRGIGTKLMQKFLKEYGDTLILLCATNDEEKGVEEKVFEEKLYSFYEKLGFKKLNKKSQIMYWAPEAE